MRHVWSVLCQSSTVDRETNTLSLNQVIEGIEISEIPEEQEGISLQAHLVSLWVRSDIEEGEQGEVRTLIETAGGDIHEGPPAEVDLREHRRFRTRQQLQGLPVDELGIYEFRVQFREDSTNDWTDAAWVPLEIRLMEDTDS